MTAISRTDRPMRIVLAAQPTSGGVARHVLDLAERLPQRGFRVLLVHARHGIDGGFSARAAHKAQFGYETASIDVRRAPSGQDLVATLALRQAIHRFGGADVLHGHSSKAGALARLGRWFRARRVVYTPNGWYTQNPELGPASRRAYRIIERTLSTVTDRIIAVSNDEAEHAGWIGVPPEKLRVIENGIEPWAPEHVARVRSDTRARLGIASDDVVVGFLGRLAPQKAPEVAVRAFKHLTDARPGLRFVLAGDGPDGARVEALIDELGLRDRIVRLPVAHGPEVIPAFDVFLMTSRYEGFPYVLLEALTAGCAIVTTRVGGVSDCVVDGVNGSIVESLDPHAIAASVTAITDDRGCLARMRTAARARASLFSIDRMIDRTADLYRSLHETR